MGLSDRIAEDKIKTAMQDGTFDNLPGKGLPLRLDENPYEPEDWRLAFHLLHNNGFDLPWIETARQIDAGLESVLEDATRAFRLCNPSEWKRYSIRFTDQIAELNRRIFQYNLQVPSDRFQRLMIDAERELEAIQGHGSAQTNTDKAG